MSAWRSMRRLVGVSTRIVSASVNYIRRERGKCLGCSSCSPPRRYGYLQRSPRCAVVRSLVDGGNNCPAQLYKRAVKSRSTPVMKNVLHGADQQEAVAEIIRQNRDNEFRRLFLLYIWSGGASSQGPPR
jgi:hypothetical protein